MKLLQASLAALPEDSWEAGLSGTDHVYAAPQWTTFTYDVQGRPLSETAPDGGVTGIAYNGLVTVTTNALSRTTTRTTDAFGQLAEVRDYENGTTTYAYKQC